MLNAAPSPPATAAPVGVPLHKTDESKDADRLFSAESLLDLVTRICLAPDRMTAARRITQHLERDGGDCTVRLVWGARRLESVFDSRRGVLASDSNLFIELAGAWERLTGQADSVVTGNQCLIPLHQDDGNGHAVLLLENLHLQPTAADQSARRFAGIAAAFWSRPKRQSYLKRRGIHLRSRYVAIAGALLVVVLFLPCRYPISCTAQIEPVYERVLAAPFEATLAECLVTPGDMVTAGQPLLRLDGRPLRLEREAVESEIGQAEKNHSIALASGRIAEAQLALLEQRRLERRRELIETRLQRLTLVSPVAGVVVSGDHRRTVGSPVVTGQLLLEIAPLDELEVEVEIPEFEIRYAQVGQPGTARMQAFRDLPIEGTISSIYPSAEVRDGENVFVALMPIQNDASRLRPGMRGSATLYGPVRPWAWSWLRPGWERIRQFAGW